ncbi:HNH/ENDO VII family nuclease [Oribacterium sp. FC2011]|uniref:HNH/ENDO VII family nuclease n=1 Tax=Oribacterium sp. FC2011 TaxID=1408311 RepID=UPI0006790676|nr:HNH/ENDO VII family nuclease [Oribacterium sp. FC2011]
MNEISSRKELEEVKNPISEGFKNIKPESSISVNEARNFIDDLFKKSDTSDYKSKDIKESKNLPYESGKKFWDDIFSKPIESTNEDKVVENVSTKEGLTQDEKDLIKKETGWSDKIVDYIKSIDEYKIYKDAGLVEGEVYGKKCLMRTDIDWDKKDQFGMTNRERVSEGYSPLDKTGKPIQLHHIGQRSDSPLAELTFIEHRTGGNDTILHDKAKITEVHGEGNNWSNEREEYWKNRL